MQSTRDLNKDVNLKITTDSFKKESSPRQWIALWGLFLVFAFLLGFLPNWLSGRETLRQRDAAQANLRLSQLQNRLATAAINAGNGEYETARIAASNFFSDLRAEVERRESGFNNGQREAVQTVLAERDEVIELLARFDPAAVERLSDLYLNYVKAVNTPAGKNR